MLAPNIGTVRERMMVLFSVPKYNGQDDYNLTVTTRATIFKDATWPRRNAHGYGEITHTYKPNETVSGGNRIWFEEG